MLTNKRMLLDRGMWMRTLAVAWCAIGGQVTIALCQEYGPLRTYSGAGRLYSTLVGDPITRESYLVSERSYQSEDTFGKEGTIRHVFKYSDGQSGSLSMNFFVRCGGSDKSNLFVETWTDQREQAQQTPITDPQRTPTGMEKDRYDLFRTLCSEREIGPRPPNKRIKKPQPTAAEYLRNCLADYVRRKGNFVPEGQSTAYVKSRSDMISMCQFAIAHKNYYWEYLKRHPELGR